jgi:hypothetical protein
VAGPTITARVLADLSGLGKAFTDAQGKGESAASKLHGAFGGFLSAINKTGILGPFGEALAGINDAIGHVIAHAGDIGETMMGVGGALAGVGVGLSALGSKDKAAHQQLQASVEATGKSYDTYADQVDAAIKHQENYGNNAVETQDSLRKLTTAFNDPQKALDDIGVAADLAAAKHISLSKASDTLVKAANGSSKTLKSLGISAKDASGHTKTQDEITKELADRLQGQASASVNTFTGHLNVMKTKAEDAAAAFGEKYGPALTAAGSVMAGLGATMKVTQVAVDALKDSQLVQSAITKTATAVQWLWNAAMDANPIMLIIIAIAALIAGIILLVTHTHIIQDAFTALGKVAGDVWHGILAVAQVVWNWIKANWPLLLGILTGPFGLAIALIVTHFNRIKQLAGDAVNGVRAAFDGMVSFFAGLPGRIGGAVGGMFDGIWNAFRSVVNRIVDGWNGLHFGLPSIDTHLPGVGKIGGESFGVPQLPHLAQGGLITASGLVYAHAGEAITPMPSRPSPAVHIENANFSTELDVEAFMKRAAWVAQTAAL